MEKRSMKLWNTMKRLVTEDDGMEMVEWAIVGVVFAVAAAAFWGDLATNIDAALGNIEAEVNPGP
jgi:Flp pilus assembly pilin Flp